MCLETNKEALPSTTAKNYHSSSTIISQGLSSRRIGDASNTCSYPRKASAQKYLGHSLPTNTSPSGYFAVLAHEECMKQQERRNRIRNYVRFVVDEHKSIKAMGITETISLFRLSAATTKPDVVEAQQRAMSVVTKYNPSTASIASASTKYKPATTYHMRSRVPMSMTIRAF